MITEIILPMLGETMNEGALVEWLKQEGEPVQRGEVLFTVESDKATLEVEAPASGFLREIRVPAGQTVPVLAVVGLITTTPDEQISESANQQISESADQQTGRPETLSPTPPLPLSPSPPLPYSPSPRPPLRLPSGAQTGARVGGGPGALDRQRP